MAASTYKCPSCGGYLAFDPDSQQWKCPFCDSSFDESVILEKSTEDEQSKQSDGHQVVYRCQSCGSEIMTDETTVAAHCYYCHSPVVLQGKLTSDMRPDSVLPFRLDRDKAVESFMKWARSKRYVPKDFFRKEFVENMTGVYHPHFITDCEVKGAATGTAEEVTVTSDSHYITTKTDYYHVSRAADISFRSILRPALSKANRKLSEGIHPYPLDEMKPFSDAYLAGFLAERRDLDADSMHADIKREIHGYVEPLLRETIPHDRKKLDTTVEIKDMHTRYVLLPSWVLTYPNKKDKADPYYYAMNGCTGEVCGKLPIDRKKLYLTALSAGAAVFAIACLLSYFLF